MKKHRDKDPYEYHIRIVDGKEQFSVSFKDGQGNLNEIVIDRNVFIALQKLKRCENRQAYNAEYHISHFIAPGDVNKLPTLASHPIVDTEAEAIQNDEIAFIISLLKILTPKQRRRFLMRHFDNMSYAEIAKREGCSLLPVYISVRSANKKIAEPVKKFLEVV